MLSKAKQEAAKGKAFTLQNSPVEAVSLDKIGLNDRDAEKDLYKKISGGKDDSAVANAM